MNELYLERMQRLLGSEYSAYTDALQQPPYIGIRFNLLKTDESILNVLNREYVKSPFAFNEYYLKDKKGISFTPFYAAGCFYFQEPSASSSVTVLDPKPGMKILDMCAAPGSKTTQIAERMNHEGLLVANEFVSKRAGILKENTERYGASNVLIINADTKDVADTFENYFDAILCDAPCSGEGMMRKEEEAVNQWSLANVLHCAALQSEILDNAYRALRPGGTLVYSTCTFATEENEENIVSFVKRHPDMEIVPIEVPWGRKAFDFGYRTSLAHRIFPMDGGEGHFVCKMHKKECSYESKGIPMLKGEPLAKEAQIFLRDTLAKQYPYYFQNKGKVYGGTNPFISTGKCRLIRHQVYLGEVKKGRFEPSHSLYMSAYSKFNNIVVLSEEEALSFLHGASVFKKCRKGYVALQFEQQIIGYGKSDGTQIKNHYPKELRIH